jgi:CTP synthase (UTP-ammonia lyase)
VRDADHAETNPGGAELVVTALACSRVEKTGGITFTPGSRLHTIFGGKPTTEGYRGSYGLNPAWRARLEAAGVCFLRVRRRIGIFPRDKAFGRVLPK